MGLSVNLDGLFSEIEGKPGFMELEENNLSSYDYEISKNTGATLGACRPGYGVLGYIEILSFHVLFEDDDQ